MKFTTRPVRQGFRRNGLFIGRLWPNTMPEYYSIEAAIMGRIFSLTIRT